jgi:hypothetical protein
MGNEYPAKRVGNERIYFLGSFANLRRATISYVIDVKQIVGSHWTDFHNI